MILTFILNIFYFVLDYDAEVRWLEKTGPGSLYDVSGFARIQKADQSSEIVVDRQKQKDTSALSLLASVYGNSSDSEDEHVEPDFSVGDDETNLTKCTPEVQAIDSHGELKLGIVAFKDGSQQGSGSAEFETNLDSSKINGLDGSFRDPMTALNPAKSYQRASNTASCSSSVQDAENVEFINAIVPSQHTNMSFAPRSDEDSSRLHVFCLEHAMEVEQQLRPIGGVNILLLCHPGALWSILVINSYLYINIDSALYFSVVSLGAGFSFY